MRKAFAPGKIILSGEYAVVFGYSGIAVPLPIGVHAEFTADSAGTVRLVDTIPYIAKIVEMCTERSPKLGGILAVRSDIPIGKGLGSSSATVIAIVRVLLGDNSRKAAQKIEEAMTPGVSGIDFTTIWENAPTVFEKGSAPKRFLLSENVLSGAVLIDTGVPSETTPELVAWVRSRQKELEKPLRQIGDCTEKLASGAELAAVMREHHKAQVALGVVPPNVQELIAEIESEGSSAKVVGAGGREGGAGLVLALGDRGKMRQIADRRAMPILTL